MNANHTRPMLAFWFLAAIAAVITVLGLRSANAAGAVSAGRAAPMTSDGSVELLLGGALVAHSASPAPLGSGAQPGAWTSAAAYQYVGGSATAGASRTVRGTAAPAARTTTIPTRATGTRARGSATAAAPAHGSGRADGARSGPAAGSHGKGEGASAKARTSASSGAGHRPGH